MYVSGTILVRYKEYALVCTDLDTYPHTIQCMCNIQEAQKVVLPYLLACFAAMVAGSSDQSTKKKKKKSSTGESGTGSEMETVGAGGETESQDTSSTTAAGEGHHKRLREQQAEIDKLWFDSSGVLMAAE